MNQKSVLIMAVLAVALGTIAWYISKPAADSELVSSALFPGLEAQINTLHRISMKDANNAEVTLVQQEGTWRVQQESHYFADAAKVRSLVIAASQAKTVEQKTANPKLYERLGVNDIDQAESNAVLLKLDGTEQTLSVLVGNSGSRAGGSSYVRKPQEAQSLLVAPAIEVSTDSAFWLDTNIINILAAEIQSVQVTQTDQSTLGISKDARFDSNFVMQPDIPGRALNNSGVNSLSRALTSLEFEDVKKAAALAVNDMAAVDVTITLFDGIVIEARLLSTNSAKPVDIEAINADAQDAEHWLVFGARFEPKVAQQFVPQPTPEAAQNFGSTEKVDTLAGEEGIDEGLNKPNKSLEKRLLLTKADIKDRQERTERIATRAKGWAYKLSTNRFNNFVQSVDTLTDEQDQ